METNVKKALEALQAIKAPVFVHENSRYHFVISGELNFDPEYDNGYWADYYVMTDGADTQVDMDDFGISNKIVKILDEHQLYAEWADPGTLRIYNA